MFEFFLLSVATWRLTYFILNEDGPWGIAMRLRVLVGAEQVGEISRFAFMFTCLYCMSFWVAAGLWLLFIHDWHYGLLKILAASAVAVLFDKVHDRI